MPRDNVAGLYRNIGFMPAIDREKMRRRMIDKKHSDGDAVE